MQEDFLHYLWRYKKFEVLKIKTVNNELISIISVGDHNLDSGPDFFNSQLRIGNQLWAGNVEIHVKSSDWYLHNHETDSNYDNVILHVVWVHDTEIYRKDNTAIPTLELKGLIGEDLLYNYKKLFSNESKWINCEHDFATVDDFIIDNWLERLYFERLEQKSETIKTLLKALKNDWEAVLFVMLVKNFGLNTNGEAFYSIANSIEFSIIRKVRSKQLYMEALLFGQAGLLEQDIENGHYLSLVKEYQYLKQKFKLNNSQVLPVQFFRLRPPNFPTIRLSQLASIYYTHQNLFSKIIEIETISDFYKLFKVSTSTFWSTHYTFQKESKPTTKTISKVFVDLLLINTILPIKFCYAQQKGNSVDALILNIASAIPSEKNSVISAFNSLKRVSTKALDSQALIQLKKTYCDKNKCLQCAIGNSLISRNI